MKIRSLTMVGASAALMAASFGVVGAAAAAPGGANADCTATDATFCYDAGPDGSMAGNGNGQGPDHEAGSRGKADYKNPPGQVKKDPGSIPENGYECDDNRGIAQGNPAHSGCYAEDPPS